MNASKWEKAILGAFSVIVKTDGSFAALVRTPDTSSFEWDGLGELQICRLIMDNNTRQSNPDTQKYLSWGSAQYEIPF